MRLRGVSIVGLLAALFLMTRAAECVVPDGAVAIVNGEAVSRAEFGRALMQSLGAAAIDGFVDWVLVEQEAARWNVSVTDEEIQARRKLEVELQMRRVFEKARMSAEEFQQAEERYGWDEGEVRSELDRSIPDSALRIRLLTERLLRAHITVTDEDVRHYYESTQGERYAAAHVELTTEGAARDLMERLQAQPQAWNEAVLRFSLDRGSVPYKGRLVPVPVESRLGEALRGMKPGELKLFHDGERWHVLQFISHIPAAGPSFEEVKDALKAEVYRRRVEGVAGTWLARLSSGSTVVVNLSPDPTARAVLGSEVAAFVNGAPVPVSRFSDALVELYGDKLIGPYVERQLIFQHALAAGLSVSEEAIEERLGEISDILFAERAADRGMTPQEFATFLAANGSSPARYRRQQLRDLISLDDVRAVLLAEQMVADGVQVAEQDVQRAYQDSYGERIDVRRVVVDDPSKAEAVHRQALQGVDFELLVQTESNEPLAWMHKGLVTGVTAGHPYFEEVKDQDKGEISRILHRGGEYEILKVVARHAPQEAPPFDTVRDVIYEEVKRQKTDVRIKAWLEKLKAEAQIEVELG